ncbi:hypothetical protein ABT115_17845 [Streptomyces sp. NPDC001832]|uniref:hypothetical protein n=1 Tax=Streptomyces sp. NPDC001832 TaxID=3154527 RepID=UPI00331FDFC9
MGDQNLESVALFLPVRVKMASPARNSMTSAPKKVSANNGEYHPLLRTRHFRARS